MSPFYVVECWESCEPVELFSHRMGVGWAFGVGVWGWGGGWGGGGGADCHCAIDNIAATLAGTLSRFKDEVLAQHKLWLFIVVSVLIQIIVNDDFAVDSECVTVRLEGWVGARRRGPWIGQHSVNQVVYFPPAPQRSVRQQ